MFVQESPLLRNSPGCQQAQSYLFSRPVPIDDVERLMRSSSDDKDLSLTCRGERAASCK